MRMHTQPIGLGLRFLPNIIAAVFDDGRSQASPNHGRLNIDAIGPTKPIIRP
jgi:hypothetical protein